MPPLRVYTLSNPSRMSLRASRAETPPVAQQMIRPCCLYFFSFSSWPCSWAASILSASIIWPASNSERPRRSMTLASSRLIQARHLLRRQALDPAQAVAKQIPRQQHQDGNQQANQKQMVRYKFRDSFHETRLFFQRGRVYSALFGPVCIVLYIGLEGNNEYKYGP